MGDSHCGGRSAQSGRESSRDIECNQRSREVPVRITEWGRTTPVTLRLDSKHVASSHRIIPGLLLDKQSQNTGISPRKISMQRVAPSSWCGRKVTAHRG